MAILIGAAVRNAVKLPAAWIDACKGVVKRVIPITIVLTGASLNLAEVSRVGLPALTVILAAIACGCATAIVVGRMAGTKPKSALLVGCGTAICGTSAIVAAAPLVGSDDEDLVISVSTINLIGLLVMLALPPAAMAMGMSQNAFGVWAGSTVHAVPQAVTTGYTYGTQAGVIATLTKLVRVTMLAPFLVVVALMAARRSRTGLRLGGLLPAFIWGFLGLAVVNTLGLLPVLGFQPVWASSIFSMRTAALLNELGTVLLTVAMAAMGLEVNLRFLLRTGGRALVTGAAASGVQIAITWTLIHLLIRGG